MLGLITLTKIQSMIQDAAKGLEVVPTNPIIAIHKKFLETPRGERAKSASVSPVSGGAP